MLDKNPDINLSLTESELHKHLNIRASLLVLETLYLLNYSVLLTTQKLINVHWM